MQSALVDLLNLDANFAELGYDPIAVFRITVFDLQLAVRDCGGHEKSSGLNSIGNDRVLRTAETFHAFNLNRRRTCAPHARAHLIQEFGEIPDLRLARTVMKGRRAARQSRRHHQILGAGYRDFVEKDFGADQSISRNARNDVASFQKNFRTEFSQTREMEVDWPGSDSATTRQRNPRFAKSSQQRTERQHRRAHRLH